MQPRRRLMSDDAVLPPRTLRFSNGDWEGETSRTVVPSEPHVIAGAGGEILAASEFGRAMFCVPRLAAEGAGASVLAEDRLAASLAAALATLAPAESLEMPVSLSVAGNVKEEIIVRITALPARDKPLYVVSLAGEGSNRSAGFVDALTGLVDRRAIEPWRRRHAFGGWSALFLDLAAFKQVNDQRGHAAGDEALRQLAARWRDCLRDEDLLVRYGGDEFVVLLARITAPEDAELVARRLAAATAEPIRWNEGQFVVSVTIGMAHATDGATSGADLIAAADAQMYRRKAASRPR